MASASIENNITADRNQGNVALSKTTFSYTRKIVVELFVPDYPNEAAQTLEFDINGHHRGLADFNSRAIPNEIKILKEGGQEVKIGNDWGMKVTIYSDGNVAPITTCTFIVGKIATMNNGMYAFNLKKLVELKQ